MRKILLLVAPAAMVLAACGSSSGASKSPNSSPAASVTSPTGPAVQLPVTSRSGSKQNIEVLEVINSSTYSTNGGPPRNGGPTGQPAGGDNWAFTSVLQQNESHVGSDHVTFVFAADGTAIVTAAETFANGNITAQGTVPFDRTLAIPITSGTGSYSGATGTLTVVSNDPTHSNLTFSLKEQ